MEIIAKTDEGFLIRGTNQEVKEILRSVQGAVPDSIEIGQKIPAIDYAGTITKLNQLTEDYHYKQLLVSADSFVKHIEGLQTAVKNASEAGIRG